jgi:hypothetical protein
MNIRRPVSSSGLHLAERKGVRGFSTSSARLAQSGGNDRPGRPTSLEQPALERNTPMLKHIAAALLAASVIAAPAFAADTSATKPAAETTKPATTAKPAEQTKVEHKRHVRHHVRHHRHVKHVVKPAAHAKHANGVKKVEKKPMPKSPGQAATPPATPPATR